MKATRVTHAKASKAKGQENIKIYSYKTAI
jgi:hypothetical protein